MNNRRNFNTEEEEVNEEGEAIDEVIQKFQVKEIIEYTSVVDSENKNSFNQLVENDKANQELVAKLE